MKNKKLSKSEKKNNLLAIISAYIILSAFLISCRDVWADPEITNFIISPNPADVGETIHFDWDVVGYQQILINFGDRSPLDVTGENNVSHIYSMEGSYDVILTAIDHTGDSVIQVITLVIENEAPMFDFAFNVENNIAYEDEVVNISVIDLIESEVDKAPGVLNYIFNFADGIESQVSTNKSSILHSWSNAGTYPMTVSAIDDQGALNQKIKEIKIINKPPSADIQVSVDEDYGEATPGYIATFNWQNDMMNSIPSGWEVNNIEERTSVSIVDSGIGDHGKVLMLVDDSTQKGISMSNSFDDQDFGTVEFWVKTSTTASKTWAFSLWGDSGMALQVLVDDMSWKYTTSTSYKNVFPSSNVEDNIWYHFRVDFCLDNSSGNYNNLTSQQFKITVNDLESSIFNITNPDLTKINALKLETGLKDIGTSWINAIGYSWDPFYQSGDNRWPVVTYSDKAVFLLKAVNIKETESDVESLRYFWQFGDGTCSFGKHVYHQYGTPGLYKVILMLKDDNGEINFSRRYVSVNYLNPTLDINSIEDPVIVYEGETIGFNTNVNDDTTDMTDLQYFWNFEFNNPVFDPNNLDDFEIGGWRKSHIYSDDYNGNIYSVVRDTNNYTSYSSVGVNVLNVDPTVSIWDASMVTDCSVIISRSSEEIEADFTVALLGNNDPILIGNLDFSESDNNFVYFEEEHLSLSLSKYWQVLINSSIDIPDYCWFKYDLIFRFQNGEILVISSDKLYGGSAGYWEVALNPYFYDTTNYNFKYPVTFHAHIWDPSTDDIDLSVSYDANFLLNLSSTTSLPGGYSSINFYNLNNANYRIHIFEQDGFNYANISINQLIATEHHENINFPVALNLNYTLNPLLNFTNLYNIIEIDFPLSQISLINCQEALHQFSASVSDDDGGNDVKVILINTINNIDIDNLCPKLIPNIPSLASESKNITVYAQVWDYEQNSDLMDAFLISPIDYYNTTIVNELVCYHITNSSKVPLDTHSFIETTNGTFYLIDSTDPRDLLKSRNEGNTWNSILTLDIGYEIAAIWYDRNMEVIYLACSNNTRIQIIKVRLADDNLTYSGQLVGQDFESIDLALINNNLYLGFGFRFGGVAAMVFRVLNTINMSWTIDAPFQYMGSFNDRMFKISSFTTIGTNIYFLWQWINENVELWCFNVSDYTFTDLNSDLQIENLLSNTDMLEQPYRGLTHEGSDIISFLLKNIDFTENGHYPATFSFKNDEVPNEPDCFEEYGTSGGSVNVISELGGHKKVLELYDNQNGSSNANAIKELSSNPVNGTVEYWMRFDTTWKTCVFRLSNAAVGNNLVLTRSMFNVLQYFNGSNWKSIRWVQNNTWYHIRVDFECTNGGYMGLSQYTWYLFVNGLRYGPFPLVSNQVQASRIEWNTDWVFGLTNYSYYIDAIGFSWDPEYTVGDNINPIEPGHYPATFSFRYDDPPNEPDCFEEVGTVGGTVNVRSMIDGHKDVVELYDNHTGLGNAHVIKELDTFPSYGTIEYWMRSDNASKICGFRLDNGTIPNEIVTMRIVFNILQYYNGTGWNNIGVIPSNTWYHFRIDFECTNGGYMGLSQYNWRLFVNNVYIGLYPFASIQNQASRIEWYTDYIFGMAYYNYYIDAIGFSWDPDYTVGDNMFPIEPGYYPATYSFEDDFLPNEPDCFEEIGTNGGTVNVINIIDGHKKVLELYDNQSVFGNAYVIKELSKNPTSGTIEYWMRTDNAWKICGFLLDNGTEGSDLVKMRTLFNMLQYKDGEGWHNIRFIGNNMWYHIRIDFECTDGNYQGLTQYTWRLSINGFSYGDYDFTSNVTQAGSIRWHTDFPFGFAYYSYYIDAIGLSWDPGYEIGDNKHMESRYYYCTYNISSNTLVKYRENGKIALMLDRNTAPGVVENAYSLKSEIYQLNEAGMLNLRCTPIFNSKIRAISDNYVLTEDGSIYKLLSPYFTGNCSIDFTGSLGGDLIEQSLAINYELSSRHSTVLNGDINFEGEGSYLITMKADNGNRETKSGKLISIELAEPLATIRDFPNGTGEGQEIQLYADISVFGQENPDPQKFRMKWIFGDGSYSYVQNPRHAWSTSGTYNITLLLVDCYGNTFITNKSIVIEEQPPEIEGPFYFQGVEGQAIVLDIGIHDRIIDEKHLTYTWYDHFGAEISHFKNNSRPTIILNDGEYVYTLEVKDKTGNIATANITLRVEDIPPIVRLTNYGYYGVLGGIMKLNAYVYDYVDDITNLYFEWTFNHGTNTSIYNTLNTGICNTITFNNYMKTTVCSGQLKINDSLSSKVSVVSFTITNIIDNNHNNIPDDYEWMVGDCGLEFDITIKYDDDDEDGLINVYETNVSLTDPDDPDTDGDGLYDGYDLYGIGERPFQTDPNNPDTDGDSLDDPTEVFGWNITTELLGNIIITSNPHKIDTDGDGLLDNEEFEKGTNPRDPDTDDDGLNDYLDPYPFKRDNDEDGLSDFLEFWIGTDSNNADTDGDSLTDAQEVFGSKFRTNPLSRDTDNDFLPDSEEVNSYQYKLEERSDLKDPVSLRFDKFLRKALSAQIAICIVFGEASTEGAGYGILDVPDIEVTVTKISANFELYKGSTNGSRYFSKVIDIRELIENKSLNYWGGYQVSINNTGAGCLLEQFEIGVSAHLNPRNPDYDRDKIMDGVEKDLLVNGTKSIDFNDKYSQNNLTTHYEMDDLALMHYSATNSFENDTIGDPPGWFETVNTIGGTAKVIKELGGHSEVLELYDNNSLLNFNTQVIKNLSSEEYGTIEYWMRADDASKYCNFLLGNDASNMVIVSTIGNILKIFDGTSWTDINVIQNNVWYHFRIDFESTNGGYSGLSQYQARIFINGRNCGAFPFINNEPYGSRIAWYTGFLPGMANYNYYIDAIGLSWDSDYKVGDNLVGKNGSHFLEYGHFPGTYSSEQDFIGGDPTDWIINETGGSVNVIEELNGHKSLVEMNQSNSSSAVSMSLNIIQQSGTIEWWWRTTNASQIFEIGLGNTSKNFIRLRINNGTFEFNNGTWNDTGLNAFEDTWYHLSLAFECTSGGYRDLPQYSWFIYINGIEFGNFSFENQGSEVTEIWFKGEPFFDYLMYIDAIGFSWDSNYSIGDNLQESTEGFDEFSIEIPDIGVIYDASLILEVQSNGSPTGSGTILIELVKEDINRKIGDVYLVSNVEHFNNSLDFSFNKYYDLSIYLDLGIIARYFGKYRLNVKVFSTERSDIFNVTQFFIEADTFVQAGPGDTEAWITDPGKKDTDGDFLSDYREIYWRKSQGLEPTNPLSKDTDGDGTSDFFDRDPLRDIIIEISPIYGFYKGGVNPLLEMTFSFSSGGEVHNIYSAKRRAGHNGTTLISFVTSCLIFTKIVYKTVYQGAYFEGTDGGEELHYYVNIEDHKLSGPLKMTLGLWCMDLHSGLITYDKHLIGTTREYNIGLPGNSELFNIEKTGHKMVFEIKTIALNKTNTIAIHDDSTVFNGHYQTKERVNIIQLYIIDGFWSLFWTPFVKGVNTIVIPTSLFKDTLLNKFVQDKKLDQTPLYHETNEDYHQFISVDRQGTTEEACSDIDFIFVRFDVTRDEAVLILLLLLTCIVNETTNATAIKYKFSSTKWNGFSPVLMNIPLDALNFVLWNFEFKQSKQGSRPRTYSQSEADWWAAVGEFFVGIGEFFVGIFVGIGEFFAAIWTGIVGLVTAIALAIIEFLSYILWCLVRAVILIYVWIAFGISVLFLTMGIGALALAFIPISLIFGAIMYYTINSVGINFPGFSFATGYDTSIGYYEPFDIPVPYLRAWCSLGDNKIIDVTIKFWPPEFIFNSANTTYEDKGASQNSEISSLELMDSDAESLNEIESLKTSGAWDWTKFRDGAWSFPDGCLNSLQWWKMALPFGIAAITIPALETCTAVIKYTSLIIAFTTYIAGFLYDFNTAGMDNNYQVFWYMLGAGIISIFTGIKFYHNGKPKDKEDYTEDVWKEELEAKLNKFGGHLTQLAEAKLIGLITNLLSGFIFNIIDNLCSLFGTPVNGDLDSLYSALLDLIIEILIPGKEVISYKDIFKTLKFVSMGAEWIPSYSEGLKLFSLITVAIGALQIIIGSLALYNH